MPGNAGIIQGSKRGEGYVTEADFWGTNAASADIDAAAHQAGGEAFLGDLGAGGSIGSAGGMVGGIIGMIVGAIVGGVDGYITEKAVKAQLEEEQGRRIKLEEELEDVMNMRDEIENNLAGIMHPLEQKFRTRAKIFGAQSRAQGVTGAQALSAGIMAEEQYRQQVGPQLPSLIREAKGLAREQALTRLREIEVREGIILEREKMQMAQDVAAANQRAALMKGISQTAMGVGTAIGQTVQDGAEQQDTGSPVGPPTGLNSNPIEDIYGGPDPIGAGADGAWGDMGGLV
jgi:hypothetical protein